MQRQIITYTMSITMGALIIFHIQFMCYSRSTFAAVLLLLLFSICWFRQYFFQRSNFFSSSVNFFFSLLHSFSTSKVLLLYRQHTSFIFIPTEAYPNHRLFYTTIYLNVPCVFQFNRIEYRFTNTFSYRVDCRKAY